jgi:hypothetical protein
VAAVYGVLVQPLNRLLYGILVKVRGEQPVQKLVEPDYTIPDPQTAEEVISYYVKRVGEDVKLLSQFCCARSQGARVPGAEGVRRTGRPIDQTND